MEPARWQHIKQILLDALDQPADERDQWVRERCGGDIELQSMVLSLLAQATDDSFLEPPVEGVAHENVERDPSGSWSGRMVGEYRILRPIAQGGMGMVFLAEQGTLRRKVAIKMLPWYSSLDPAHAQRFEREAHAIAQLNHPNVAAIHTVGQADGSHYFSMEYLPEGDLGQELARLRNGEPPRLLPPTDAPDYFRHVADIACQVAEALAHAHEKGIVHRDVKPQNLMIAAPRTIKVVDFGLAKSEALGSVTASIQIAGTPHYMSPEQAKVVEEKVDHRTDIYSLGVVLYEMITLHRPYQGDTSAEVLHQIRVSEPRALTALMPTAPSDLVLITERAMEKSPQDRFQTAAALAGELRRFLNHQAILTTPRRLTTRIRRRLQRHARIVHAAWILIAAILLGIWISHSIDRRATARALAEKFDATVPDAEVDLESFATDELLRIQAVCDECLESAAAPDDLARRAQQMRSKLNEFGLGRKQRLLRTLDSAREEGGDLAAREQDRSTALVEIAQLRLLRPDDEELEQALREPIIHPAVSVRAQDIHGSPVSATAFLRRIDVLRGVPGPPRELGATPIMDLRLPPGYYRFVVRFEQSGFREFTRYLHRSAAAITLHAVRRDDESNLHEGMIRYPAEGNYRIPPPPPESSLALQGLEVPSRGFWLDETEVSNEQYQEFLSAHPSRSPPRYWNGERPAGFGQLPVVGLSYHDMVAYAEWRGKRLPTYAEWSRAARGRTGRPYPWAEDGDSKNPRTDIDRAEVPEGQDPVAFVRSWYLQHARPVRSAPELCNPEGVFHLYGNVSEATETIPVFHTEGAQRPQIHDRLFVGFSWTVSYPITTLDYFDYTRTDRGAANADRGFRCARSLQP